jgi:nifR3 family TIM-barrel protein
MVCTEQVSSNIIKHSGMKRARLMFDWQPDESPITVQLFGNSPATMAEAARVVVDQGADIVDINMGCWVPKIARKGGGAALLRDLDRATRVVEAVVNAVTVPVTVKVRSGWEPGALMAVDFARAAEQVGAQAIAVHARFAQQGHQGEADWEVIRQVKEAVTSIPVIGNGDVTNADDAGRMLTLTGCDGVMIGRAALGNPWIFRQIMHRLETGESSPEPSRAERAAVALEHARRTLETTPYGEKKALLELRGQISKYRLDEPGSVVIRNRIVRIESLADLEDILLPLIETTGGFY